MGLVFARLIESPAGARLTAPAGLGSRFCHCCLPFLPAAGLQNGLCAAACPPSARGCVLERGARDSLPRVPGSTPQSLCWGNTSLQNVVAERESLTASSGFSGSGMWETLARNVGLAHGVASRRQRQLPSAKDGLRLEAPGLRELTPVAGSWVLARGQRPSSSTRACQVGAAVRLWPSCGGCTLSPWLSSIGHTWPALKYRAMGDGDGWGASWRLTSMWH